MTAKLKFTLLALAALSLAACTGVSTVKVVANGPAEVFVEGVSMGNAPVAFPLPWRNVDNNINYSARKVTVKSNGTVVFDRDISGDIAAKAQTGDFTDGSQFGSGRTYTLTVDVHPQTRP